MSPAERLAALEGRWHVRRVVRHVGGGVATLSGQTVWTREANVTRCLETGWLEQDDTRFHARRLTLWRADGPGIDIRFEDERPFHRIGPGRRPQAHHDCPPDTYDLAYDFTAWPRWSVRWHVQGPRKDYRALTRYWR